MSYLKQYDSKPLLNLEKRIFPSDNPFGFPNIPAFTDYDSCEWIGFNYAKMCKNPQNMGCHFFLEDYMFARTFNTPDKYIRILQSFKYVLAPDFSMYADVAMAVNLFNKYRKHWLAAYWVENGINVIPCISWMGKDSYSWCFDGEPKNSVVAISTVGTQGNKECMNTFLDGYLEMLERLTPIKVLVFGLVPEEIKSELIIECGCFQQRFDKLKKQKQVEDEIFSLKPTNNNFEKFDTDL